LTESLGLRLAGVDIICHDLSTDAGAQLWNIIEINSVPGLNNYAALGPHQLARVKALYRAILLQIQQDNAIQKPESG